MFSTIKKMIHKEETGNKKPILDIKKDSNDFNFKEEPSNEDYSLPEPDDINRLPLPRTSSRKVPITNTVSSFSSPVERERRDRIDNFRKTKEESKMGSFEPPPVKPLQEYPPRTTMPVDRVPMNSTQESKISIPERTERNVSLEILNRLEAIEKRLSRIEQIMEISTKEGRDTNHLV